MVNERALCTVVGVVYDQAMDNPMVLLRSQSAGALLPLPITVSDASSIIIEAEGVPSPQPLAQDVVVRMFKKHGFAMEFVELRGSLDHGYAGTLWYRRLWRRYGMEVRPADGIVLALRMGSPIFVGPELLQDRELTLPFQTYHGSENILYFASSYTFEGDGYRNILGGHNS